METDTTYVVATIHIPIRVLNGVNSLEPLQSRCQIEFRQCANLDDYPENHSLETQTLMNKFSQFLSPPVVVAEKPHEEPSEEPFEEPLEELQEDLQEDLHEEPHEESSEEPQEEPQEESPIQKQESKIIELSPKPRSKQKTFRIYNNDGIKKTRFTLRATP
jgi:hypothetical protein